MSCLVGDSRRHIFSWRGSNVTHSNGILPDISPDKSILIGAAVVTQKTVVIQSRSKYALLCLIIRIGTINLTSLLSLNVYGKGLTRKKKKKTGVKFMKRS